MARIFASIVILVTAFYGTQGFAARVASLNPGLTDIVLSLGLEDALVAVSDYCVLPGTLKLTRIGSELTPRTEALIVAEPTHILTSHSVMKKELPTHLEKSKLELPLTQTNDLKEAILRLGKVFGKNEEAVTVATTLEEALKPSQKRFSRVLVAAGISQHQTAQLYLMNPNSLHGDLLTAAGFHLIRPQDTNRVWMVGPETFARLSPDLVIVLDPSAERASVRDHYERTLKPAERFGKGKELPRLYLTDPKLSSMGPKSFSLGIAAVEALEASMATPQ